MEPLALLCQCQNAAPSVRGADGAVYQPLLLQPVHDAIHRAGLDHQMALQCFLVHAVLRVVQEHQRPALHGRYVVALQHPPHQLMHLVIAVAEQCAEVRRVLVKAEFHGGPPSLLLNF